MYMEFKKHPTNTEVVFFFWPLPAGDAGSVRPGQQPRCSDAAEAGGADGPQPKSHTGQNVPDSLNLGQTDYLTLFCSDATHQAACECKFIYIYHLFK